jgi:hypothetical protein
MSWPPAGNHHSPHFSAVDLAFFGEVECLRLRRLLLRGYSRFRKRTARVVVVATTSRTAAPHRHISSVPRLSAVFGPSALSSVLADRAAAATAAQLQGRGNSDELVQFGAKVTRRIVDFVRRHKAASVEKGAEPPAKKYATAKNPTLEGYKQLQAERARGQDKLWRELERAAAEDVAGAEPPWAPLNGTTVAMATHGNPGGSRGGAGAQVTCSSCPGEHLQEVAEWEAVEAAEKAAEKAVQEESQQLHGCWLGRVCCEDSILDD